MGCAMGRRLWGQVLICRSAKPHFADAWVTIHGSRFRSPFMGAMSVPRLGRPIPGGNRNSDVSNPMDGYLTSTNS